MRQRHIPESIALEVHEEPDGIEPDHGRAPPDREVRWRVYDGQRVEIVVDLTDGTIISAWITRVL